MQNPSTTSTSTESCSWTIKKHEVKCSSFWGVLLLMVHRETGAFWSVFIKVFKDLIYMEMWLQSHEKRLGRCGMISVKAYWQLSKATKIPNCLIRTGLTSITTKPSSKAFKKHLNITFWQTLSNFTHTYICLFSFFIICQYQIIHFNLVYLCC